MEIEQICTKLITKIRQAAGDPEGPYGCLMWTRARQPAHADVQYGRMRNPFPGPPGYSSAHRLLYMAHHRRPQLEKSNENGAVMDVSHICHKSLCVNIDHLVFETHEINLERRHCVQQGLCTRSHKPYCLL